MRSSLSEFPRPRSIVGMVATNTNSSYYASVNATPTALNSTAISRPPRHSRSQSTGKMRMDNLALESSSNINSSPNVASSSNNNSADNTTCNRAPPAHRNSSSIDHFVSVPQGTIHVSIAMNQRDTYLLSSYGDVLKSTCTYIHSPCSTPTTLSAVTTGPLQQQEQRSFKEYNATTGLLGGGEEKQPQMERQPPPPKCYNNGTYSLTKKQVVYSSLDANIATPKITDTCYDDQDDEKSTVTLDQYGEIIGLPSFDYSYIDSPSPTFTERKMRPKTNTGGNSNLLLPSIGKLNSSNNTKSSSADPAPSIFLSPASSIPSYSAVRTQIPFNEPLAPSICSNTSSHESNISVLNNENCCAANSMIQQQAPTDTSALLSKQQLWLRRTHGIPQKLSSFNGLRVTVISAHPMGDHALFITSAGLLFGLGDNSYGQCGVGLSSTPYITEPTMVTAFLENGGKAVAVAAGVDYSLVVIRTDLDRIQKLLRKQQKQQQQRQYQQQRQQNEQPHDHQSSSGSITSFTSSTGSSNTMLTHVGHHQMYAFGNNEWDKLGLINPTGKHTTCTNSLRRSTSIGSLNETNDTASCDEKENENNIENSSIMSAVSPAAGKGAANSAKDNIVPLPRRVALHSKIFSEEDYIPLPRQGNIKVECSPGIFCVAASRYHSMALNRLPDGTVELYSWGAPIPSVAGCGALGFCPQKHDAVVLTIPTVVNQLSRIVSIPSDQKRHSTLLSRKDFPVSVALGMQCSLITCVSGQVLAMGHSAEGILGLGHGITQSPNQQPARIHAFCMENSNSVPSSSGIMPAQQCSAAGVAVRHVSIGGSHAIAVSSTGQAYSWGVNANGRLGHSSSLNPNAVDDASIVWTPRLVSVPEIIDNSGPNGTSRSHPIKQVYRGTAGPDASAFIMSDGQVFSCGKKSGRLGQGTVPSDSIKPAPMFGGLYLWKDEEERQGMKHF